MAVKKLIDKANEGYLKYLTDYSPNVTPAGVVPIKVMGDVLKGAAGGAKNAVQGAVGYVENLVNPEILSKSADMVKPMGTPTAELIIQLLQKLAGQNSASGHTSPSLGR